VDDDRFPTPRSQWCSCDGQDGSGILVVPAIFRILHSSVSVNERQLANLAKHVGCSIIFLPQTGASTCAVQAEPTISLSGQERQSSRAFQSGADSKYIEDNAAL
jgi:hypothetical protein